MTSTIIIKRSILFLATAFVVTLYLGGKFFRRSLCHIAAPSLKFPLDKTMPCCFFIGLPGVEGRKCWVCRSDADPKCADPFDNTSLPIQDCSIATLAQRPGLEATMCRKTRQKG